MKNIFILYCCLCFIQNIKAQDSSRFVFNKPSFILKTSLFGVLERATCFQLDAEYLITHHLSVQASGGWYNDFLTNNSDGRAYTGIRYGGEIRYNLLPKKVKISSLFVGLSMLNNQSTINTFGRARYLKGVYFDETTIPVKFEHQRLYTHFIVGNQMRVKRIVWDVYVGAGTLSDKIGKIEYDDAQNKELLYVNQGRLFPTLVAWQIPNYDDEKNYFDFNFFLKIGYILF